MDEFSSESSLDLPNLDQSLIDFVTLDRLQGNEQPTHKPRILLLYGSTRERSFSRLLTQEAARILTLMGAETVIFDPSGLPLPDDAPEDHPKVKELRDLVLWSEGQVWCSPERHGAMSAVFKAQIDWIPLTLGAVRPSQGKTLAVMQVCGVDTKRLQRTHGAWIQLSAWEAARTDGVKTARGQVVEQPLRENAPAAVCRTHK
jgi:arsenic resistance protein ArsH